MISSFKSRAVIATGCIVLLLTSCSSGGDPEPNPTILGDPVAAVANLENDALVAPTVPDLKVTLSSTALEFSWQVQPGTTLVNLYSFDTVRKTEVLIGKELAADTTSYTLAANPLMLSLDTTQYRLELCEPDNCVSSFYQSPTKPVQSETITNHADSAPSLPYLNHAGNVLLSIRPEWQSADIYFKTLAGWQHAGALNPASLSTINPTKVDAALSTTGDTFAIATYQALEHKISISVFDRLGEAWFETSQWDEYLSDAPLKSKKLIAISHDAKKIVVVNGKGFATYTRQALMYKLDSMLQVTAPILTWDANTRLSCLVWASSTASNEYTLHKQDENKSVLDYPAQSNPADSLRADHLNIQLRDTGDEAILAGWLPDEDSSTSLVLQQLSLGTASIETMTSTTVINGVSKQQGFDFGSSDTLAVSYITLNKQTEPHAHVYHSSKDGLNLSVNLPDYIGMDSAISAVTLSGDGSTLTWANNNIHTLR